MAVTLEELFKSSPRREFQSSKSKTNNKRLVRNTTLLESFVKNGDITSTIAEDGTVKMKILVKKQDLNQMLEAMNNVASDNDSTRAPPPQTTSLLSSTLSSIERRMYDLMKRRRASSQACQGQGQHSSSWRPALQSIPEELYY